MVENFCKKHTDLPKKSFVKITLLVLVHNQNLCYNKTMFDLPLVVQCFIVAIFGCCIGSFLCVCVERLPKGLSVVSPGSRCPHCGKSIPWYLNIPIISWLFLRGKSKCCKKAIPLSYFLSELSVGIMAGLLYFHSQKLFIPYFLLFCLLWVAFFIDLKTMTIPDEVTLLGIVLGVLASYFLPELQGKRETFYGLMGSIETTCLSMGGLFLFISIVEFFLKKEAMGLGDVKLMGCIGAFLGSNACLFSLFFGAILGTVCIYTNYLFRKFCLKQRVSLKNKLIPFGPFLALSTIFYLFFPQLMLK